MPGRAGGARLPDHHRQNHSASRYAPPQPPTHAISGPTSSTLATMDSHFYSTQMSAPRRPRDAVTDDAAAGRRWTPRLTRLSSLPTNLLIATLLAVLAVTPASAVRIEFQNCLPDSYRLNTPKLLQWVPLYADAVFDTTNKNHSLQVVVWGNVTGSSNEGTLPAANDSYWDDPDETNGKIIHVLNEGTDKARKTTLYRKVNFLSYEPFVENVDFCKNGLDANHNCPLSPVFNLNGLNIPDGLPSFNLTNNFYSSYAFASFAATFIIINGDEVATDIGCISATITPDLGHLSWLVRFLPLLVLLFTGFAVLFAAIFSPWGSTDIFHWTTNYGRDVDLLRLITPGFGDCLQYIQFIALTGGLTLDYPGFFQPIVSQVAWSTLMFNESFVADSPSWQSVVDGIYVTNGTYGLQELGQLVGMAKTEDIWAGMMVWLCVCILCVSVLTQIGFLIQFLYRKIMNTPEEDLRAKNIPFSVGNVVRIIFNYFLLPIVTLSCFQLVVASRSPAYTVALSAVTIVFLILFASYLFHLVIKTRPKSVLYDDLPTVLQYGPLYNTFADEAAAFALIPVLLTFIRGIAIGAVQPSGIAQVVLLAICEVIQILTLHAFRPFQSPTSMNAYHTLFSSLRLITIMLMVAFVPTLGVTEGEKGWIGYVILAIHGAVLVLGFFLNALQTIVEVVARMLGAGGDDVRGLTRGGLSKIFGMRQLSRRVVREGPSRASQLSTAAMLDADDGGKSGYVMPSGRLRSESGASLGGMVSNHRHRSSSALDSIDAYSNMPRTNVDSGSSYAPGTPGQASTFSFLPSPTATRQTAPTVPAEAADPYYRPPRRRRGTLSESIHSDKPRGSLVIDTAPPAPPGLLGDPGQMGADISRGVTPAQPPAGYSQMSFPPNRPDYATREVDFYYGVRGPALNSDAPGRRLGTGPADPTGPVATASGFFRTLFGGKIKEKGKGFEVVRSSRMPPAMMARNGGFEGESPPEGIPVAMGVLRNGPIDSDDDDEPEIKRSLRHREGDLLDDNGDPQDSEPESPVMERRRSSIDDGVIPREPSKALSKKPPNSSLRHAGGFDMPHIPRRNSRRSSAYTENSHSRAPSLHVNVPGAALSFDSRMRDTDSMSQQSSRHRATLSANSRLPFERTGSQKRLSSNSSIDFPGEFTHVDLHGENERPASFGYVTQNTISRVDPFHREVDLLGSSAELVEDLPPSRPRTQSTHHTRGNFPI
ncbi:Fc.00g067750.m01.CDS01 [Cosmosporella sp. VM-42]